MSTLEHVRIPEIYGVYLLQSTEKPGRFYIGSTPHPLRRLKQHNGILVNGGAYRTKQFRPWKMVLFIHNFQSKVSALQFEHAWQHYTTTRYLSINQKIQKGGPSGGGRTIKQKLTNCMRLMTCNGFKRIRLKCTIFDTQIGDIWKQIDEIYGEIDTEFRFNDNVDDANYKQLDEFMRQQLDIQSLYLNHSLASYNAEDRCLCAICSSQLNNKVLMSFCSTCSAVYHLNCWYDHMLEKENDKKQLIPIEGPCLKCKKTHYWSSIVRNSLAVKNKLQKMTKQS